jgi:hypothetical protein
MVARVRPESAGIPPSPAPPAGTNGQSLPGEQSPRAEADATLPPEVRSSLGRFSTLVGQPYQRLKVAAVRELSGLPTPHWPLVRAETVLDWLEPAEATRLLDELREDDLIVPAAGGNWRLSEEAQLVAAVCAVLAVQSIEPERLVRVLCAATSLALAAGTEDEPAIAPFLAAVDVLDADFATLLGLIETGEVRALRSVAGQARAHAADLAGLLERERGSLDRLHLTSSTRACLERAPGLADRVGALAEEVEKTFATRASELPPGSIAFDEDTLRELVRRTDLRQLGRLVHDQLPLPAAVAPGRSQCESALTALEAWLQAPEPEPEPLPQPRRLQVEPIDLVPDLVVVAAEALGWLASMDGASLTKWVVGGTWSQAVTRMAAAVEAWSRWGPFGDGSLMVELEPRPLLESVGHDEVAVASRTTVRRPAPPGEPEADASREPDGHAEAAESRRAVEIDEPWEPPEPPAAEQPEAAVPVAVPDADRRQPTTDPKAREEPAS